MRLRTHAPGTGRPWNGLGWLVRDLPGTREAPRIRQRAPTQGGDADQTTVPALPLKTGWLMLLTASSGILTASACSERRAGLEDRQAGSRRLVVVVAPVLNLSNTGEVDTRKITDTVASELLSFPAISVIPVNLSAAALAQRGKVRVETPQEALELAGEFAADATIVVALTELEPYDPPRVGLVMQWYELPHRTDESGPARSLETEDPAGGPHGHGPPIQVQRVYDAAHEEVLDDVECYGRRREGGDSPYGWRKHVISQELFVRYCCWATIQTMLSQSPAYQSLLKGRGAHER